MIREGNINYGQADDGAIDLGLTFFDNAEMYGPFHNGLSNAQVALAWLLARPTRR